MNELPAEGKEVPGQEAPGSIPLGTPWLTYAIIVICGLVFAFFNLARDTPSYGLIASKLAPSCVEIWTGAYWGLVTPTFVHVDFWHILFNMWWAKDLGRILELTLGRLRYLVFIIAAAIIACGAQLAFSGMTGIGYSGVLYAMFGYMWVTRHVEPRYQKILTKQNIQWLLGWLVLCIALTVAKVWQVGNGAHLAGLAFGCLVGSAFTLRIHVKASVFGLTVLGAVALISAVYMPWSPYWKDRAYSAWYMTTTYKAAAGDREAQFLYAEALMQQKDKKMEAISWLRKSAGHYYLPALNLLAWSLATDPVDSSRDGAEAIKLAKRLCERDGWKTAAYIDTLAAAYAEEDDWTNAVTTQKIAIDKLTADDSSIRPAVESRLQKYLNKEKVRE
jgi:membrane associated rhomboid family serine protease